MADPANGRPADMGRRFARGALYVGAANWTTYALTFAVGLFIAYLLGPETFGVYALAVAVNELVGIIAGFAIAPALVQSRSESRELFDTGYAMSLGLALIGLVVCALIAPFLWVLRSPEPALFLMALGTARIFVLLGDVGFASMDRVYRYGPMAWVLLAAQGLPSLAALALAYGGFGAWSLVLRDLLVALLVFVLTQWAAPRRLHLRIHRDSFLRIRSFAAPFFVARMLDVFLMRFDRLVVGLVFGNAAIGLYHQARYLSEAGQLATNPLMRVALNLYSRLQDDLERLARSYAIVNYFMVRVLFAGAAVLLIFPEETVRLLLREEWLGLAPLLRILALHAALFPVLDNMKVLLYARGEMRANIALRGVQIAFFVPGVLIGAWSGSLEAMAAVLMGTTLVGLVTASIQNGAVVGGSLAGIYVAPLLALAATAATLWLSEAAGWLRGAPWWALPFAPPLVFAAALALCERGRLRRETGYLWQQLRRPSDPAGAAKV